MPQWILTYQVQLCNWAIIFIVVHFHYLCDRLLLYVTFFYLFSERNVRDVRAESSKMYVPSLCLTFCGLTGEPVILWGQGLSGLVLKSAHCDFFVLMAPGISTLTYLLTYLLKTGFPRLLESPGKSWIFSWKIQDLESPGKSLWFWKVLEIEAQGPGKSWKNILENCIFFYCF